MNKFKIAQKAVKDYAWKLKRNALCVVQIGSSLRQKDFTSESDLDLLVIYKEPVESSIRHESFRHFDIQIVQQGKNQFIKSLKEGIPVYLVALKFGKVLHDNGIFQKQKSIGYKPTKKSIEMWLHTASFNLSDAFMNYSISGYEYFKSLRNASREFSRVIILKEFGEIVEGNKAIIEKLKIKHPNLCKNFELVADGRNYRGKDQVLSRVKKIRNSGIGRYFLAAEEIAKEALRICLKIDMPKINDLVKKIPNFNSLHSFKLDPKSKTMMLNVLLKDGKVAICIYNMGKKQLNRLSNTARHSLQKLRIFLQT